ncbi:MAG: DNA polymerase III subunit delta [Candidatus Azambacteria bacterium]|nr:DNA polymerase III subunit delta [Candidatus Azambacteria bacterium]
MIIFLYGQDSYRISQKIQEIVKGYEAKNPSGLSLIRLDLRENKLEEFFESVKSNSLIPEKKLIILKNIFITNSETFLKFLKSSNLSKRGDVILLIIAFNDSNKSKLFEYLTKKPNQTQNFKPPKAYEVKSWAKQFSNSLGIDLTGEALDFLISNCSLDLWQLDGEIRKLADFKIKGIISRSQVEELAVPGTNYKIFGLTDALAKKDKKKALETLYIALDNGEKPTELLGLLAWQIRNLLKFKLNPNKPSDLKLHPFVLEKIRESAGLFSVKELSTILSKIIDLDLSFKTGDLNEKTALSLLIAEL